MNKSFAELGNIELFAQVVGLHGDPTTQNDAGETTFNQAFASIAYPGLSVQDANILWSRLVLCEILIPGSSNKKFARLSWALKPRSCWLYRNSSGYIDFYGNTSTDAATLKSNTTKINPKYQLGDVIRLGQLPNKITINGWDEGFSLRVSSSISPTVSVTNISLNATAFNSTIGVPTGFLSYANANLNIVSFYDKNVDGRNRSVSSAGGSGMKFRGEWLSSATYAVGDVVVIRTGVNSGTFICVAANPGAANPPAQPDTGSIYWVSLSNGDTVGKWL